MWRRQQAAGGSGLWSVYWKLDGVEVLDLLLTGAAMTFGVMAGLGQGSVVVCKERWWSRGGELGLFSEASTEPWREALGVDRWMDGPQDRWLSLLWEAGWGAEQVVRKLGWTRGWEGLGPLQSVRGGWSHCSVNYLLPSVLSSDRAVLDGTTWHGEE
jgi:hypothetical protein